MKLLIDEAIRKSYPDLRIGVVIANGIDNYEYKNDIEEFCKSIFIGFSNKFDSHKDLESLKNIIAWRNIYRSFGINPKKKKPTAESLLSRVIKSSFIPHISPAVDVYLCAETLHYLPIGGYDLSRINGNIVLRYAISGEQFLGVGSDEPEETIEGEVVYADDDRILTRCWNYKDCDYSKISNNTKDIALFIEGAVSDIYDDEIMETASFVARNLSKYCGADCKTVFLTKEMNEMLI